MGRKPITTLVLGWTNRRVGYLSIVWKLVIIFCFLAGVPMALAGLLGGTLAGNALEDLALQRLDAELETLRVGLETALDSVETDVAMLASLPELRDAVTVNSERARGHVRSDWANFLSAKPGYHRLRFLNPWGEEIVAVSRGIDSRGQRDRGPQPYYLYRISEAPRDTGVITPVELFGGPGEPVRPAISIARGVWDEEDEMIGVVVADVLASRMFSALETPGQGDRGGSVLVVDSQGHYVYHSAFKDNWNSLLAERSRTSIENAYPPEVSAQILAGVPGGTSVPNGDIVSFSPILHDHSSYHVLVKTVPSERVLAPAARLRSVLNGMAALSLLVAVLLAVVAAAHFNQPIEHLVKGARRFADGQYAHRIEVESFDEIDDIASTFNSMADAIEHREKRIRGHAERLEELVQERTGELIVAERQAATGQLVAGIAHEIGTPLNVISGSAESVLAELGGVSIDPEAEDDLRLIVSETQRIAGLVRDLQDFARPRPPRREQVDVVAVAEDTARLLAGSARRSGVTLRVHDSGSCPVVWADSMELKQALLNLLVNAIHASPQHAEVEIHLDGSEDGVVARIVDHGSGIAPQDLPKIFEPFYTTKRPLKGTGLGLAIVRRIIQRIDGRIDVRSVQHEGTVVKLWLPLGCQDG